MTVRCSKCGEELLGAVNRCWKCGQFFALRPEIDGRPPVRGPAATSQDAIQAAAPPSQPLSTAAPAPGTSPATHASVARTISASMPRASLARRNATADMIEARRLKMMAMGGTVSSVVTGVFAALLAAVWPPVAIVAVLGLAMGIWGLYSPRRNWALLGMLLCCLAIGIGTYGGVRRLNDRWVDQTAILADPPPVAPPDTDF